MTRLLRFVKAVGVVATVWAFAWTVAGLAFGGLSAVIASVSYAAVVEDIVLSAIILGSAIAFGIFGLTADAGFAIALSLIERNRSIEQLSRWRVAFCGMIGGAALPLGSTLPLLSAQSQGLTAFLATTLGALMGALCSLITLRAVSSTSADSVDQPSRVRRSAA